MRENQMNEEKKKRDIDPCVGSELKRKVNQGVDHNVENDGNSNTFFEDVEDDALSLDHVSIFDFIESVSVKVRPLRRKISRTKNEWKKRARTEELDKVKSKIIKTFQNIENKFDDTRVVSTSEKITFAIGCLNLFYSGYIIAGWPEYFHIVYTIEFLFLMPIRIYTFRKKDWQYYLADLCYFVNLLLLLFIWVLPNSKRLFLSCYAFSFGTLSWAVITWRNSLVLHSLDKATSTFIHLIPPVTLHCIVHCLDPSYKTKRFPGADKVENFHFYETFIWVTIFYFIWQTLYYYFITIRCQEKIKAGRMTSFEYLRKKYKNTWLGSTVNKLPEIGAEFAFMFIQFGYQLLTMLPVPIWYSNRFLSTLFLSYIFSVAAYNGATYYIDVFGNRFKVELLRLQNELDSEASSASSPKSMQGSPLISPSAGSPVRRTTEDVNKENGNHTSNNREEKKLGGNDENTNVNLKSVSSFSLGSTKKDN